DPGTARDERLENGTVLIAARRTTSRRTGQQASGVYQPPTLSLPSPSATPPRPIWAGFTATLVVIRPKGWTTPTGRRFEDCTKFRLTQARRCKELGREQAPPGLVLPFLFRFSAPSVDRFGLAWTRLSEPWAARRESSPTPIRLARQRDRTRSGRYLAG